MDIQQEKAKTAPRFQRLKTFGKAALVIGGLAASTMTGRAQAVDSTLSTTHAFIPSVGVSHITSVGKNGSQNGAINALGFTWRARSPSGEIAYGARVGGEVYNPEINTSTSDNTNVKGKSTVGGSVGGLFNIDDSNMTLNVEGDVGSKALPEYRGSNAVSVSGKTFFLYKLFGKNDGPFAQADIDFTGKTSVESARTNVSASIGIARKFFSNWVASVFGGYRANNGGIAVAESESYQFKTNGAVLGAGLSYDATIGGSKVRLNASAGSNAFTQPSANRAIFGEVGMQTSMVDVTIGVNYNSGKANEFKKFGGDTVKPSDLQATAGVGIKF